MINYTICHYAFHRDTADQKRPPEDTPYDQHNENNWNEMKMITLAILTLKIQ